MLSACHSLTTHMPHVAANIVDFQRLSGDILQIELTRALNFDHYNRESLAMLNITARLT